jgi:hypothetical protein
MSSPPQAEARTDILREDVGSRLGLRPAAFERIGGGRNSQVYKFQAEDGQKFAIKVYFRHPGDQRDRLATEFNSFKFLWDNGVREIPQPLRCESVPGWAAYQFIEGDRIPPGAATEGDVVAASSFLARLRGLCGHPESRKLGIASEANFSVNLIAEHVCQRLERLKAVETETTVPYPELRDFLARDFRPFRETATAWSRQTLEAAGIGFGEELGPAQRTLSPSDFGFHNALRRPDSGIVFLDFEYFGWDDPAKMIADFLLHPAMDLSPDWKRRFVSNVLRGFADFPGLAVRLKSVYPLFGLKWCLIILNEFLPESYLRRQFAAVAPADRSVLQAQQLAKARHMLARIRREYDHFPYHD